MAGSPNLNGNGFFSVGILNSTSYWRQLIKFDVSELSGMEVRVQKAYLTFTINTAGGDTAVTAYALSNDWVETQVTWNRYSTGYLWTTAGGDFGQAAGDTIEISAIGTYTMEIDAALVQSWIDLTGSNFGLLLKASNETTGINRCHGITSENITVQSRPKLTIYFSFLKG